MENLERGVERYQHQPPRPDEELAEFRLGGQIRVSPFSSDR
jgi:hypothetical protein